ncbi:LytR C-terminal domain-containing protein [Nocardioides pantholopis]|uniref:LytR C-terminal domain-containing protein n=1 Tax=Nocardioides pantholopis TaxID=2483798 RepID=UPI001F152FB1|nr:LytR C-terminal domain-containing protein [Nocardioides pantholopis]
MAGNRTNRRGTVFPSPVVMLSIIAVAMAAITFVATRGGEPTERDVTPVAQPSTAPPSPTATAAPQAPKPKPKPKPQVRRAKVYVEVYNNSNIRGLAGRVAGRAADVGWQVVGSDNWYGTVPTTTVYHPPRLTAAAKMLARDLGIQRVHPAEGAMKLDRLTIVLTGELG